MTRVADLAGMKLDYWAGKAAKLDVRFDSDMTIQNRQVLYVHTKPWNGADMPSMDRYSPSQWWAQGGPLLDRHHIETAPTYDDDGICVTGWVAMMFNNIANPHPPIVEEGPTLLIAAMRALVASVYGEEVQDENI